MLAHRAFRAPQHRRGRIVHRLAAAVDALAVRLEPIVRDAAWQALRRLYPQADMASVAPENARAAATASMP